MPSLPLLQMPFVMNLTAVVLVEHDCLDWSRQWGRLAPSKVFHGVKKSSVNGTELARCAPALNPQRNSQQMHLQSYSTLECLKYSVAVE